MKIRDGYMVREVAGVAIVVPLGADSSFQGMMKLNGTGRFLWEKLTAETDRNSLVDALLSEYDVARDVAERDVDAFLARLLALGVIE